MKNHAPYVGGSKEYEMATNYWYSITPKERYAIMRKLNESGIPYKQLGFSKIVEYIIDNNLAEDYDE